METGLDVDENRGSGKRGKLANVYVLWSGFIGILHGTILYFFVILM